MLRLLIAPVALACTPAATLLRMLLGLLRLLRLCLGLLELRPLLLLGLVLLLLLLLLALLLLLLLLLLLVLLLLLLLLLLLVLRLLLRLLLLRLLLRLPGASWLALRLRPARPTAVWVVAGAIWFVGKRGGRRQPAEHQDQTKPSGQMAARRDAVGNVHRWSLLEGEGPC
jgi:hypothetical protein